MNEEINYEGILLENELEADEFYPEEVEDLLPESTQEQTLQDILHENVHGK